MILTNIDDPIEAHFFHIERLYLCDYLISFYYNAVSMDKGNQNEIGVKWIIIIIIIIIIIDRKSEKWAAVAKTHIQMNKSYSIQW